MRSETARLLPLDGDRRERTGEWHRWLVSGSSYSCAIDNAGAARCWGSNAYGQIGDGTMTEHNATDSAAAKGVTALAAGYAHACASSDTSGMRCWGWNDYGQVGDGTMTRRWTAVDVSGLASGIIAVAAGGNHNCSLRAIGGGVDCWGRNDFGQLGDGTTHPTLVPVHVGSLGGGVRTLVLGVNHSCALTAGHGVKCWGADGDGQLGDGTTTDRPTPVDVSGLTSGVLAIAAGLYHSCALTSGGGLKCRGNNFNGQLGDGSSTDRPAPTDVSGLASGVVVSPRTISTAAH